MAPEFAPSLVIFDSRIEGDELKGTVEYIEPIPPNDRVRVRWGVGKQPEGFREICRGAVYVYDQDIRVVPPSDDASPNLIDSSRYQWTEGLQHQQPWLMFVLVLPRHFTLENPQPMPAGTKALEDRLALYWILKGDDVGRTKVEWTIREFQGALETEIRRINKAYLAVTAPNPSTIDIEDVNQPNKESQAEQPKGKFASWVTEAIQVPLGILNEAIAAVPAVKYALGVAGLAAAIAIIKTLVTDWRVAVFGVVVMILLMTVLFIFAQLTRVASEEIKPILLTLIWFCLVLFIATGTALFLSVFFRWPVNLQYWLTRSSTASTASEPTNKSETSTGENANFRVIYYSVGGSAIDALLKGKLDKRWEATLGGQSFIVKNEVITNLRYLVKTFSEHALAELYFDPEPDSGSDEQGEFNFDTSKPLFVGSGLGHYFRPATAEDFASLAKGPPWRVEVLEDDSEPGAPYVAGFSRFANQSDIRSVARGNSKELRSFKSWMHGKWFKLYEHMTREYFPADFCIATTGQNDCTQEPQIILLPRMAQLHVALVENTTSNPLRIGKFSIRKNMMHRLRTGKSDQEALNVQGAESVALFQARILRAGEKLLIPLRLSFEYEDDISSDPKEVEKLEDKLAEARKKLAAQIEESNEPQFRWRFGDRVIKLEASTLREMLIDNEPEPELEYVFGPSIAVDSIEVENLRYDFRKYETKKIRNPKRV